MSLEWISNHNPKQAGPEDVKFAAQYVVGEPKATKKFTVQQLKNMGFVGLYKASAP